MLWLWILLAILIAAGAGYIVYRADVKRAVPKPWLTAGLRSLVIFLVLLLLLAPAFTITKNETQKPIVLFLQDGSRSVADALGTDSTQYKQNAEALLGKLQDKYKVVTYDLQGSVEADSLFQYKDNATDIATALSNVQEYYGTQNLGAVILATDGKYNQGVNPLYAQQNLKGALYTVGIGDTNLQKDVRISKVYANKTVSANNSFEIRADILADRSRGYNNSIRLLENGQAIATATVNVNADRYDRAVTFIVKADKPGLHHYTIAAPVAEGEENTANNNRDVFVEVVDAQKHILIAGAAPHPDIKAIREALSGLENYKITVRVNNDFPSILEEYDILILHNLPGVGYRSNPSIVRANKPAWYILGSRSDVNALSNVQKPVVANANPAALRGTFGAFNPSFSAFTVPQNIRQVTDRLPPLNIPQGKIQAAPGAQVLFADKSSSDVPLWALMQGRQPTAMITGDGLWRWRMYEYKNFGNSNVIDECIRQTIAFLSTDKNDAPFDVSLPKYIWSDQEGITLNAYLRNANNEPVNEPEVQLEIRDSAGRETKYSFERSGNAYRINIGIRAGGTYTYNAHTEYNGKKYAEKGTFVVESIPLELMETGADYSLLYSLAKENNGAFFPASQIGNVYDSIVNNATIKPVIETNLETVPLIDRKWFFFLILLFAVTEWLLRKYWLAQ